MNSQGGPTESGNQATPILIQAPKGIPPEMLAGYLSRSRSSIHNLNAALQRGELEAVRVFGHRLKGSGGAYGIPELSEIGRKIEYAARSEDSAELQNLAVALESYVSRLEVR